MVLGFCVGLTSAERVKLQRSASDSSVRQSRWSVNGMARKLRSSLMLICEIVSRHGLEPMDAQVVIRAMVDPVDRVVLLNGDRESHGFRILIRPIPTRGV